MISITYIKNYCQDYQNIQNYAEAVKSTLKYDLHHRREISESKSRKQLIEENLYYGRPPEELIFLEHGEHIRLHNANRSEDTRQKMSDAHKGKHQSAETRQKMSDAKKGENNPMFGKRLSVDTRQKMSESHKGEKCYMYGKPKSAETRKKMSENNCRYWKDKNLSKETRKRMSEAHKGKLKGLHWHLENGHRIWTE